MNSVPVQLAPATGGRRVRWASAARAMAWMGVLAVTSVLGVVPGVQSALARDGLPSALASTSAPPLHGFADLAERLLPAVVNISTTQTMTKKNQRLGPDMPQFPPGSPFEEFFREFFDRKGGQENAPPRRATSLGSGFIVDAKAGLVVTNNHVIQDADEITVILHDDTNIKAEVVGRDAKTDLAVLRIPLTHPLTDVKFGDSERMRVGDWVVAIGNPFGLGGTVTAGIVSARARDINAGPYDDFLQTDASINRGNSGGPMFNLDGEVIGINTAIFSPSGGSVGIGFAIPSNLAKPVLEQLQSFGRTKRGWLGVRIQAVTPEIAESLGLDRARGALVANVTPGGPAEAAGIEPGDVILQFDGKDVNEMRRLPRIVAETNIKRKVDLTVWRKGREHALKVTVGELEAAEDQGLLEAGRRDEDGQRPAAPSTFDQLGLKLSAITPELRRQHDLGDDARGVVVVEVDRDGAAADKGVRPGDIIVEVSQQEATSPADVAQKVEQARAEGKRSVLLLIDRQGDLRFVALPLKSGKDNKDGKDPR